jgi:hypothetical protein
MLPVNRSSKESMSLKLLQHDTNPGGPKLQQAVALSLAPALKGRSLPKDPRDVREAHDPSLPRDSDEPNEPRENKQSRKLRDLRDSRDQEEAREGRAQRESREDQKDSRYTRDNREGEADRESGEHRYNRERREARDHKLLQQALNMAPESSPNSGNVMKLPEIRKPLGSIRRPAPRVYPSNREEASLPTYLQPQGKGSPYLNKPHLAGQEAELVRRRIHKLYEEEQGHKPSPYYVRPYAKDKLQPAVIHNVYNNAYHIYQQPIFVKPSWWG